MRTNDTRRIPTDAAAAGRRHPSTRPIHPFCGAMGPEHAGLLAGIVERSEWVCFPAGAGSGVRAQERGTDVVLDGRAAFGSGARYADWAGVAFAMADADGNTRRPLDLRF